MNALRRRSVLLIIMLAASAACATPTTEPAGVAQDALGATVEFSIPSAGATLHARSIGGSPGSAALVLVHGGPGISSEYLQTLDGLATPSLRVVTYDQQGV